MDVMTTMPRRRDFTREDLDALPDDGWRHELVDGSLVMTPAPSYRHQDVVGQLHLRLTAACPRDLKVLLAPFDVVLAADTVVEPDLLVARRSDLTERDLPAAPVLAVEVLSPSTRHIDLGLKLRRYETAGCPSYWVVDPGTSERAPSLRAWDLRADQYVEVAHATGAETCRLELPFALDVVPDDLLD